MRRKIDATNGTKYTYEFANGNKVTLFAGKDGVTEEMICQLKRMDNREYTDDLDAAGILPDKKQKEQMKKENPDDPVERIYHKRLDYVYEDGKSADNAIYNEVIRKDDHPEYERIYELTDQLPPKQQAVLRLYLDGYSQSEIARMLGLSTSTIRDHMSAAKKFLKENF